MRWAGGACWARACSRRSAALSRGLEVHPGGDRRPDLELWIDPRYVDAGYGWSFPARDELRIGVGSFDPRDPVKQPTLRLVADVEAQPHGYQGNWIPHRLRPATEGGVFFAGDSAGHCLPLTAEGIRTAFYFGIALGRELRAVLDGRQDRAAALAGYHAFSGRHRWKFEAMYAAQQSIRHLHGRPLDTLTRAFARPRLAHWGFRHYLELAPPSFAVPAPPRRAGAPRRQPGGLAQLVQTRADPLGDLLDVLLLADQRRRDRHAAEQRAHQHAGLAGTGGHLLRGGRLDVSASWESPIAARKPSPARTSPTAGWPASEDSASRSGSSSSRPRAMRFSSS